MQSTPIALGDIIRVFVGFRDKNGVGRVGFIDVDANNPSRILKVADKPCLDVGEPGCFDDNGLVACAIARVEGKLYLFNVGYTVGYHIRMAIFSGMTVSNDNGEASYQTVLTDKVLVIEYFPGVLFIYLFFTQ